jgi:restriction system protein
MAVPDFQTLMLPLLRSLRDGHPHSTQETIDAVAADLGLQYEVFLQRGPEGERPATA